MNSANEQTTNDVYINVRKAYRLLHDYQCMVRDAVRYIEAQLDIPYNAGWAKLIHPATRDGFAPLTQSGWAWLPMVVYEFHFRKKLENDAWLSLWFLILSDTGWFQGDAKIDNDKNPSAFAPVDQSFTKFAFIMQQTEWDKLSFMEEKIPMRNFIKEGGCLPNDLIEKGCVGKCYDMSCLDSLEKTEMVIKEIIDFAKKKEWLLDRKKAINNAVPTQ